MAMFFDEKSLGFHLIAFWLSCRHLCLRCGKLSFWGLLTVILYWALCGPFKVVNVEWRVLKNQRNRRTERWDENYIFIFIKRYKNVVLSGATSQTWQSDKRFMSCLLLPRAAACLGVCNPFWSSPARSQPGWRRCPGGLALGRVFLLFYPGLQGKTEQDTVKASTLLLLWQAWPCCFSHLPTVFFHSMFS